MDDHTTTEPLLPEPPPESVVGTKHPLPAPAPGFSEWVPPRLNFVVWYVFPDGNEHDDSLHKFPWQAFERADALRAEFVAKDYRQFVVGVGDRDDPELGNLSEDDYCPRCTKRWTDGVSCPTCGLHVDDAAHLTQLRQERKP